MLSLHSISKQFGGRVLFSDVFLHVGDRERISIVGANGSGKSTLMKIITGQIESDTGKISLSRGQSVGYLPQDGIYHSGRTLYSEIESALEDLLCLQEKIRELSQEISTCLEEDRLQALTDELGELQHELEHRQGYNLDVRIKQIASGLGFSLRDLERQTHEFSGGWQMRIALAKLLLREPSFLLLDEPTNHLDIATLEWLETYLQNYEGSIIVVSHDKRFLDNLVKRTIEISLGKITEYKGNYSFYVEKKAERMELLQARYDAQQRALEKANRFVERFRYKATKARQVQSRLKLLGKMERVKLEDTEAGIHFVFPPPPASGRVLMELDGVAKAYGDLQVFRDATVLIERGDRIAFLGANGTGKSTLARIMAGREDYQGGTIKPGKGLAVGYYAQDQADILDPNKTVLETLEEVAPMETATRLRSLLGCFLFEGDDVFKPVSVLSGGEKSRIALARMMLLPANLLIMDEPTNHLDIRSKEILGDALAGYEGSFVIVSHDRDFLEPLINKVFDFKDGVLRLTLGTVGEYLEKLHEEQPIVLEKSAEVSEKKSLNLEKARKREEAERRQALYRKLKPIQDELEQVETKIAAAEKRKAELEAALADTGTYKNEQKARALSLEFKTLQRALDDLYDRWTILQEQIEEVKG